MVNKKTLLLVTVLIMVIGLSGCADPGDPSVLNVTPEDVTINLASGIHTTTITASVRDEENVRVPIEDSEITWTIEAGSDPIATLDSTTGVNVTLQANRSGEAKVTAKYGNLDPAIITVKVIDEELMPESGYKAPKVAEPLVLGEEWPVKEANAYNFFENDIGWNLWVFWDDANVYVQYDVYTDLPLGNKHTGAQIWNADSLEWEIRTPSGLREKWIIGLTDEKGYEIVARYPDRLLMEPGQGVDVLINETDFGYRGQVILDQSHERLAQFNISLGLALEMAVQVNDSADGTARTRILGGYVDSGTYTPLTFMYR